MLLSLILIIIIFIVFGEIDLQKLMDIGKRCMIKCKKMMHKIKIKCDDNTKFTQ